MRGKSVVSTPRYQNPTSYHDGLSRNSSSKQFPNFRFTGILPDPDTAKSEAKNRGTYVDRVSSLTDQCLAAGLVTPAEKDPIMRVVAQNK